MSVFSKPVVVRKTYELDRAGDGTGVTSVVNLDILGKSGFLLKTQVRIDVTRKRCDEFTLYLADDALADVTIEAERLVFSKAYTGGTAGASATAALNTELNCDTAEPQGIPYHAKRQTTINAIANITSAGGSGTNSRIYLTVWALVYR